MQEEKTGDCLWEYNNILKENENIYRDLARKLGLSVCQFWILYTLRTESLPLSQRDICTSLYLPKQTINSALKKMESEGYLALTSGKDHRSKGIMLTSKGILLCERTVDQIIAMERSAFADLSEEKQEFFLSLFRQYTNLLKTHIHETFRSERNDRKYENTII